MGIIDFIFRRPKSHNSIPRLLGPGSYSIYIVGESKYQKELELICGRRTKESQQKIVNALLVHEDDNTKDNNAIRIEIKGLTVGYLSQANAIDYCKKLEDSGRKGHDATCSAIIVGGWDRGMGDQGHFGVRLDLPLD